MKISYFFPIAVAATLLFNCKGDIGAPGPVGPAPLITEESFFTKEGFMKATWSPMVDSVATTFNFNFQGNLPREPSTYAVIDSNQTRIEIFKKYAFDGEPYIDGSMSLTFTVDNLTNLKNIKYNDFDLRASRRSTPQKIINISAAMSVLFTGSSAEDIVITDLKYDAKTSVISGKFKGMVYSYSSSGRQSIKKPITDGSFSTQISRIVNAARESH